MYNANNLKGGEEASIDLCLEQLGLEHVDLLLVHNPCVTIPEYKASIPPDFLPSFIPTLIPPFLPSLPSLPSFLP